MPALHYDEHKGGVNIYKKAGIAVAERDRVMGNNNTYPFLKRQWLHLEL